MNATDSLASEQPAEEASDTLGHVHFLGLAGVGVSAVARLMAADGVPISGTDAKDLPVLEEFRRAGATVHVGYSAANLAAAEAQVGQSISTVIASSIAAAGNPEYDEALRRGLPVLHRSQGLAALMRTRRSVAVAGTHGKTTTSSMATVLLEQAGLSPTFAVGANVAGLGVNAALGSGEWFIAEADESDGSLLNYAPEVGVVTNVEPDHLDHYGTAEAVEQVFVDFTERISDGGHLVLCADDPGARKLLQAVREPLTARGVSITSYGTAAEADLRLDELSPEGGTVIEGAARAPLRLSVPGLHNQLNALAAIAVGRRAGLALETCAAAISHFQGTSRRFELRGEVGKVRVYDDYAHHPTEVSAVLQAARSSLAGTHGRVHAIFQPHLFSRTAAFAEDFGRALTAADTVAVLEIYPAREEPIDGVTSELLGHPVLSASEAVAAVVAAAEPGDMIMTLGAGDVTALGADVLAALQALR
ncbi:UDP-N-acetylmuramate--L-alanine ligase [Nesterenkonia lutea]|uniref:UDP-N-acetylmuramate--L-alanine ligase n=1 Tax=Nesterenkonia lutea TaxID=272919 RepID=A0ABR9JE80_9MICC|nr:UDP-N-acetylmuramate--L-alanine ligase [Nesterenkonia lutea]MBE1524229.1 UDP-N-acetylmuramate--alanine ligase [Nesterenkonia lutea]